MKSPIGLFLAEFRADAAATPDFAATPDLADFDGGGGGLTFALPEYDPPPLPVPDPATEDDTPAPASDDEAMRALDDAPAIMPDAMVIETDQATALAEARQQWAAEQGAALAQRFADALAGFETRMADMLAPMLEPFLVKGAQLRVLDDLRDALRRVLRGDERPAIMVTGPADLLAAIETAFAGEPALAFEVADTPDVTITAGETLIRSRLRDWASTLEESLGEAA